MEGRYIGVYFFIPLGKRPGSDDELFAKLGVQEGHFGLLIVVDRNVTLLSDHVCAQLCFLADSLHSLQSTVLEEPLPLARATAVREPSEPAAGRGCPPRRVHRHAHQAARRPVHRRARQTVR
jgi:hypothetical protein